MKSKLLFAFTCALIAGTLHTNAQRLWAVTPNGGVFGGGTIITMNPDGSGFDVEFSYQCSSYSGCMPMGNLMQASNGQLYGTCYLGGAFASCTIDRYDPVTGTYYDIYDFDIINGDYPNSGPIEASNGKLYGVASSTSVPMSGVIYSIEMITNMYVPEHVFSASTGCRPLGCPILKNGVLYGLASQGGIYNYGVLYSYSIVNDLYTALHHFDIPDGTFPNGSLIEASDGLFYGLTVSNGDSTFGTIFSFNPANNLFAMLHSFNGAEGANPRGTLMQAADGKLYGVTSNGGSNNYGVLFSYDIAQNTFTKLYDFVPANGSNPTGNLYQSTNQMLYGTASNGGANANGVIFSYDISTSTYTNIHDFAGATEGAHPAGGFVMVEMPTGISRVGTDVFSVYPNPANEAINITFTKATHYTIALRNVTGEILFSAENYSAQSTIDASLLPKGIYFVEVKQDNGKILNKKIVKM